MTQQQYLSDVEDLLFLINKANEAEDEETIKLHLRWAVITGLKISEQRKEYR